MAALQGWDMLGKEQDTGENLSPALERNRGVFKPEIACQTKEEVSKCWVLQSFPDETLVSKGTQWILQCPVPLSWFI